MIRRIRKETLARNLINTLALTDRIDHLPHHLDEGAENIMKEIEDLKYRLKINDELRTEFIDDKVGFIHKYAKPNYKKEKDAIIHFIRKEKMWDKIAKNLDKKTGNA